MAVREWAGQELLEALRRELPEAVGGFDETAAWVTPSQVGAAALFLRDEPSLDFRFLNSITAIDYVEYFDVVYHLTSFRQQWCAVFKTRLYGRQDLSLPSVYQVWKGADYQEREIWDLMGVYFEGHPNMKRIMLWEGFEGHPLRKDFL